MRTIKFLLAILFSLAVVACGGGGYGGGGSMGGGSGIYSISGTVTHSGNPLQNATITLTGAASTHTMTDVNGKYSFTGLQNGGYTVTPSGLSHSYNPPNASRNHKR